MTSAYIATATPVFGIMKVSWGSRRCWGREENASLELDFSSVLTALATAIYIGYQICWIILYS